MREEQKLELSVNFLTRFKNLATDPESDLEAMLALVALALSINAAIGMVTVTAVDPSDQSYERLYSSMPEVYPVSGRKPPNRTYWSEIVIENKQSFVANDKEGVAEVMADHELIASLGFESIINIPLVLKGQVRGTLNCLAGPEHFTPRVIDQCEAMIIPVLFAILAR